MKKSLSSQYKALFQEELQPQGFHLYKKTFYRVIGGVVQMLMLRKTSTNFSVDFSILPLSLPIEDLYCEGYDIATLGKRMWWDCWPDVEENAFGEIMSLFRQYIKPLFERATDSKRAYAELINYEKMVFTDIPGGVMGHSGFAALCIQSQDYEKAYQHMSIIAERWDRAYQHKSAERENACNVGSDVPFNNFMLEYQEIKEKLHRLSIPDAEYFQTLMAQNEAISIENLKHPRYPSSHK